MMGEGIKNTRMITPLRHLIFVILALFFPTVLHAACAGEDGPCQIEAGSDGGSYHIALPDEKATTERIPAVVFLHGWGSDGASVLRNSGMVEALTGRGYAVIAPDGTPRQGRTGRGWQFHPGYREGRDEGDFLRAVAKDAAERFGLDRDDMLLAGFSLGGSMVSYVACESPESFRAYAPVAGNLWRPLPETCKAPVRLFHTHGWSDGTVPLEGRAVRDGEMIQGDVFAALQIWRRVNACQGDKPTDFQREKAFLIRKWDCDPDAALGFVLHPGGHTMPPEWANLALEWYEALPR